MNFTVRRVVTGHDENGRDLLSYREPANGMDRLLFRRLPVRRKPARHEVA